MSEAIIIILLLILIVMVYLKPLRDNKESNSFTRESFNLCIEFLEIVDPEAKLSVLANYSEKMKDSPRLKEIMKNLERQP